MMKSELGTPLAVDLTERNGKRLILDEKRRQEEVGKLLDGGREK